jgi:hypothetical protein
VHDALARHRLGFRLGFSHVEGKQQGDLLPRARVSCLLKRLPINRDILEFIPIKPSVAGASDARESYATHSKFP